MLKQGDLFLFGEITDRASRRFYQQLCYVERLDIEEIKIYICSYGGDVECACAIIDKMKEIGQTKRVITIAAGKAYSAAAIILASGQIRKSYRNSYMMFHPCSYMLPEDSHINHKSYVDFADETYDDLIKQICENCGMGVRSAKNFVEKCKGQFWLTAAEAYKAGIIQEIIGL